MTNFAKNIEPYVKQEFDLSAQCARKNDPESAFKHLENAHVLGQESTYLHVQAHIKMAIWALRQRQWGEFAGQLFRIIGAASKTAIGLVPSGNTGGANVSPFKRMPLTPDHERLIAQAKVKE